MKLRYIGKSFGLEGLTNNKIYECIGIEPGYFRIIDNSEEDYLYGIDNPGDCCNSELIGKWEVIEDDENGSLKKEIEKYN